MKLRKGFLTVIVGVALATLGAGVAGCGQDSESTEATGLPESVQAKAKTATATSEAPADRKSSTENVQPEIDEEAAKKLAEKRKKITEEAIAALSETRKALKALEKKKSKRALTALEKVTGKLELILARDPGLALAPTDVGVVTYDVLATLEAIDMAKKEAKKAFDDADVQKARGLLEKLRSEVVIAVHNIPLASYPEAIKKVAPLIDDGKTEEAKEALEAALNTLVITEHVIPLPIVRAHAMLEQAEKLAENSDRKGDESKELPSHLENARYQLRLAEALGYSKGGDFDKMQEQIAEIEKKTSDGKSGTGFFDKISSMIDKMMKATSEG